MTTNNKGSDVRLIEARARLEALEGRLRKPEPIDPEALRNEVAALRTGLGLSDGVQGSDSTPDGSAAAAASGGGGSPAGPVASPPPSYDADAIGAYAVDAMHDAELAKAAIEIIEAKKASFLTKDGAPHVKLQNGDVLPLAEGFQRLIPAAWFRPRGASGSGAHAPKPIFRRERAPGIREQYSEAIANGTGFEFYQKHRTELLAARRRETR